MTSFAVVIALVVMFAIVFNNACKDMRDEI
jgi:hypothetical protein